MCADCEWWRRLSISFWSSRRSSLWTLWHDADCDNDFNDLGRDMRVHYFYWVFSVPGIFRRFQNIQFDRVGITDCAFRLEANQLLLYVLVVTKTAGCLKFFHRSNFLRLDVTHNTCWCLEEWFSNVWIVNIFRHQQRCGLVLMQFVHIFMKRNSFHIFRKISLVFVMLGLWARCENAVFLYVWLQAMGRLKITRVGVSGHVTSIFIEKLCFALNFELFYRMIIFHDTA